MKNPFAHSKLSGLGAALLMVPLPLWLIAGGLVAGTFSNPEQRRRRIFILLWTAIAFFAVPIMGGVAYGAVLGYAITHGTTPILTEQFAVGCSIAALALGRVGYVLSALGWLPGTQITGESARSDVTV
jgi:hypothetical protein